MEGLEIRLLNISDEVEFRLAVGTAYAGSADLAPDYTCFSNLSIALEFNDKLGFLESDGNVLAERV